MPASNAGDYKKKYHDTRKKMLDRPSKGSHGLLKLKFAEGIKGNKNQNV